MIEWDDSLDVGVKEFNDHHKELIRIINSLSKPASGQSADAVAEGALKELSDYADYHFRAEEEALEKSGYPGLDEQKKEHAGFASKVDEFLNLFGTGQSPSIPRILAFMNSWLISHIKIRDTMYKSHLNARGIK